MKLEEWEVVCDRCSGLGKKQGSSEVCEKCHGQGKLDWIENIVGKRKIFWKFSFGPKDAKNMFPDKEFMKELTEIFAEQLAKNIDKEIMEEEILKEERS